MGKIKVTEKKLGREGAVGICWCGENTIEIDPRQPPKEYLDTLIHELLHHFFTELTEEEVIKTASEMTDVLWKQGFRRIYKKEKDASKPTDSRHKQPQQRQNTN